MVHTRSRTSRVRLENPSDTDIPRIKEEECKVEARSRELLHHTNHRAYRSKIEKEQIQHRYSLRKVKEESGNGVDTKAENSVNLSLPTPASVASASSSSPTSAPVRRLNKITGKPLAIPYKLRYKPHQVHTLITSIVNAKMSIKDASIKAGITPSTGNKYYLKYLREGKIPGAYIGVCTKRKLFKKHTRFIVDLYKQNRNLTIKAVTEAVNNRFPNTDISPSALKQHINSKIPEVYKTTAAANGENNRKLQEYHIEFIVDLLKNRPELTLKGISEVLHEAHPGLCITATSVSRHIHTYHEDLYQETLKFRENQRHTAFERCVEFVRETYKKNPKVTKEEVYEEVKKVFPDLNMTPGYLHDTLKKELGQWYLDQLNAQWKVNRKILPEHTKFIRDLYKKKPKLTLKQGCSEVEKKFPGFSVGEKNFRKHLAKCGIETWGSIKYKKARESYKST